MFRRLRILTALVLLVYGLNAHPQRQLRIAAAADLQPLLPSVLMEFEQQTGIHPQASYQSSATLAMQIINGAPFDLFLAADLSFPGRVVQAGRAEEDRPVPYARGTLVLWTRKDSELRELSLGVLEGAAIHSIAIANPGHAPYGRAAQMALEKTGLLSRVRSKLVIAENIAQAAQYADSGNAQVGFISLTSALTPKMQNDGYFIRIPPADYPPILQGAVIVRNSAGAASARKFLEFLSEPATAKLLAAQGLEPVSQSNR